MISQQLPLPMTLSEETTFANFYEGDQEAVVRALNASLNDAGERFIYLAGPTGVGKTHLLQACCHEFFNRQRASMYVPLKMGLSPAVLQHLETMPLVCVDDIPVIVGNAEWEEALLHFYNRARDNGVLLIVSGNRVPTNLTCRLADLQSRLSWGLTFSLKELTDTQKIHALQQRAHDRGLEFPDEVGQFLLHHYPRHMPTLFQLLDKLDHASFIAQRKLTVPFVKSTLGEVP